MRPEDGHWLAGLIDGEGSFIAHLFRPATRPKSLNVQIQMVVGLRADDKSVLEHCQGVTGLGKLNYIKQNERHRWLWMVTRKADCQALVEILDRHPLRSKKSRDFAIWREIVREHATWKHGHAAPQEDQERLFGLARDLRAVRLYDPQFEPLTNPTQESTLDR